MTKHLSPAEIELLAKYQLTGEAFAEALIHLESCERCQRLLPTRSEAELARRLLADEPPPHQIKRSTRYKLFKRKWNNWFSRIKNILFKDNANCWL